MDLPDWLAPSVEEVDDCWLWCATKPQDTGYVTLHRGGVRTKAHRWVYALLVGPVPALLDHECHNADLTCAGGPTCRHRRCVRPDHLVEATMSENARRGRTGQTPGNTGKRAPRTPEQVERLKARRRARWQELQRA